MKRYTRDQMAARVARDIPEGAYVNLGIGLPTMVANHLPREREIFLHSEHGLLGMGPAPAAGSEDPDLINAGKKQGTLLTGGAHLHHTNSFSMMNDQTKGGESKIVAHCTYPLTGGKCVNRIYTDLAVIDVTPEGLVVVETVDGLAFDELARITGVPLRRSDMHRDSVLSST